MDPYALGESSPLFFVMLRRYLLELTKFPAEVVDRILSFLPGALRRMAPRAITLYGGYNLRANRPPTRDLSFIGKMS